VPVDAHFDGAQFTDINALLAAPQPADAIVLQPSSAREEQDWLTALRRDPRMALRPIYAPALGEADVAALLDGAPGSPEQLRRGIEEIDARLAALPARELVDDEERLLAYLYTRPARLIEPLPDWRSSQLYRYPLLDALDRTGQRATAWAQSLKRRGLIERVRLVDRVRQCMSCASSHLNYVDECPACGDLDIGETIFLHCHTCGHVAPQEAFLSAEGLSCGKCQARLRHIGVDYDRALETCCCLSCGARFSEAQVSARCLDCGRKQSTTDLAEHCIESFRLSDRGERAARTGNVGDLLSLIDDANCAHPALFAYTLEWLLNLRLRHKEVAFGVVCIRLANIRELIDVVSRARAAQLIDSFATRLRELVRSTDLLMRSDERHCWLLLPQTDAPGVRTIAARIRALPALSTLPREMRLELGLNVVVSAELGPEQRNAKLLMAEMLGGLD
jgi:GGDEF domain-containing protein